LRIRIGSKSESGLADPDQVWTQEVKNYPQKRKNKEKLIVSKAGVLPGDLEASLGAWKSLMEA
jgi:hypothetical protein